MFSLLGRRRTAEERREERRIKEFVQASARAQGITPRALRKQARAELKPFLVRDKRQEKQAKQFWKEYDRAHKKQG